jgi:hypothetical protein
MQWQVVPESNPKLSIYGSAYESADPRKGKYLKYHIVSPFVRIGSPCPLSP